VWVEIHVDDEIVGRQPDRWTGTRALLDRVAAAAEARGARLCFRIREAFARASSADGFLPALEARGHEIGVHGHGRRLSEAVEALRGAGVEPRVAVPGLVQVGWGGRAPLLRQVASLGIGVVTDHGAQPAWAYDGLLPRREEGVLVMAPTVRPFDWGLMSRDGARHGLGPSQIAALRTREAAAEFHGAAWFGAALHEHDLCVPGTLEPDPTALDALASYLDPRVIPALQVPVAHRTEPSPRRRPLGDGHVRMARLTAGLARRVRGTLPGTRRRAGAVPPGGEHRELRVDGRRVAARRFGPGRPKALCVLSHAGSRGGQRTALEPFGLELSDLLLRGWGVWLYDRAGTGDSPPADEPALTPGNPAHDADWRVVLGAARKEGAPLVAVSWSGGLLPVLRGTADGIRPDALVDAEGPVDRWSLVPPGGNELSERDPWDDASWAGLEAISLVPTLQVPYARLQAETDHVHGRMSQHALRMHEAVGRAGQPTRPLRLTEGELRDSPMELVEALQWCLRQVRGW